MARKSSGHRTSHPEKPGPVPGRGGATLAVKDNANVRADGFGDSPPVKNSSPASGRTFPAENPPTRGGRYVKGG